MKFVIAFFMAWGNFITLPCPYKRWDNNLKNMMLSMLPAVGAVVGVLWALVYYVLNVLNLPLLVSTVIMVFYIFIICGFMHLDGFMDCNDAILSRRPLEDRQRILKDPTVGSFAAVTLVFLILAWFACMLQSFQTLDYGLLAVVPVVSRGIAGAFVLTYKPIGHSQYVNDYKMPGRRKYRVLVYIQVIAIAGICALICNDPMKPAIVIVVEAAAAFLACMYARRQLGGMSGDIAGYTICMSELAAIVAIAAV